jgi:hypothetical protein
MLIAKFLERDDQPAIYDEECIFANLGKASGKLKFLFVLNPQLGKTKFCGFVDWRHL